MSTRFGQDFEVEVQAEFEAGVWSVLLFPLDFISFLKENRCLKVNIGLDVIDGSICDSNVILWAEFLTKRPQDD